MSSGEHPTAPATIPAPPLFNEAEDAARLLAQRVKTEPEVPVYRPTHPMPSAKQILLVAESGLKSKNFAALLSERGYKVTHAADRTAALQLLADEDAPALVILDYEVSPAALRSLCPGTPILHSAGCSPALVAELLARVERDGTDD